MNEQKSFTTIGSASTTIPLSPWPRLLRPSTLPLRMSPSIQFPRVAFFRYLWYALRQCHVGSL